MSIKRRGAIELNLEAIEAKLNHTTPADVAALVDEIRWLRAENKLFRKSLALLAAALGAVPDP